MICRCIANINQVPSRQWNTLVPDNAPFAQHEFLAALELSGCVKPENGWLPQHIICLRGEELIAAMPFYIKGHSYGEYVFDRAWVDAYHQHGHKYYPKGLCAIPYTPVSSTKILVKDGVDKAKTRLEITRYALEVAKELKLSSLHSLFLDKEELNAWQDQGFISRSGYQFHWRNDNYIDFDDYLANFTSAKRKKIHQQRRSINRLSINLKILHGDEISEQHWLDFYRFYKNTIRIHGAIAYLNLDFFLLISESMKQNLMMVTATKNKSNIASALFFKGRDTLYGRYWGCDTEINNLHFETCYYQAIDYCIVNNFQHFEAGAQGEHKLSRGLLPVETISAHWLRHPEFFQAIKQHLEYETDHVQNHMLILEEHSPFKSV